MRKQTKLVAVLSAAALLAIGASMTSFAAWQKSDDGTWQYFDRDGEMVAGEWQKDGAKWFYLDDDGNMLTDSWVDDEAYVGDDGAMLVNTWKKTVADEEVDDPSEDGDYWYYFSSKGKKTTGDKKIGGKTYYFDTEGRMYDGWHEESGDVYYLGGEDEGWRASGWLWLEKPNDDDTEITGCDDNCTVGCDEEGWYYFGSDGRMYEGAKKKKVNGKYYFFNEHGQMLYEWINGAQVDVGSNAQLDGENAGATISDMIYTNTVEEGWRADGWYEIDGSEDVGTNNDTDWYYFKDGAAKKADILNDTDKTGLKDDGNSVYRARIKVLGKYFSFDEKGRMQTGLQWIGDASTGKGNTYYFDENGYMKTGKVANVEEENDSFAYYFNTKTGGNGKGVTGDKDGYLYWNGKRLEADDDYEVYKVEGDLYLVNNKGKIQKSASKGYDVENNNEEDVKFAFTGSKLSATQTGKAATAISNATLPKIELFDAEITTNGAKDSITISNK